MVGLLSLKKAIKQDEKFLIERILKLKLKIKILIRTMLTDDILFKIVLK